MDHARGAGGAVDRRLEGRLGVRYGGIGHGGYVDKGVADMYMECFVNLAKSYPRAWWICCTAELELRYEWAVTEKRRQREFHSTCPMFTKYDPSLPWNSILLSAFQGVGSVQFWDRTVKGRERQWRENGGSGTALGATSKLQPGNPGWGPNETTAKADWPAEAAPGAEPSRDRQARAEAGGCSSNGGSVASAHALPARHVDALHIVCFVCTPPAPAAAS